MKEFIEVPASKNSMSNRKPILGVGINDAKYVTNRSINGVRLICPFYSVWTSMLERCCSNGFKIRKPSYYECKVHPDWLVFSAFKSWMESQDWKGKELDKDLLFSGNKLYGPLTCVFISGNLNKLLNSQSTSRGDYPQGVCFDRKREKYRSACNVNGAKKHLGYFDTAAEASDSYLIFKSALIEKAAYSDEAMLDERIKSSLLRESIDIRKNIGRT